MMMRRVVRAAMVIGVLAAAVACDSDSPNSPSDTVVFTATLLPANEVPVVTNAERSGSGTVVVQFALNRDGSNTITSGAVHFAVDLTGFPEGTRINVSHIHRGVANLAGPIVVNTGLVAGELAPINSTGQLSYVKSNTTPTPAILQEIIDNPGNFYFNVHSATNPAGVARGQLQRQ